MKIKLSDRLLHPELSNNFLSSQGKFTTETSYYNLSDIPENYKAMPIETAYEFIYAYQD